MVKTLKQIILTEMNYTIIATLGPSSQAEPVWREMISTGVTGFRLNTSHLSMAQLQGWLDRLEHFRSLYEPKPALILDLQGSKWRLGDFQPFMLENRQAITLRCTPACNQTGTLPVPHPDFFQAASLSSGEIVLDDAKISLAVEMVGPDWLKARVTRGGEIFPKKGITFTACEYRIESLSERDQAIVVNTRNIPCIQYAISYIKDAEEMARYRLLFGSQAEIIAKLERKGAIEDALKISDFASELWLCRGDLGAELGMKAMAEAVKLFTHRLVTFTIPVLLAGQVLEHMTDHSTPTRSEVCHLYDILDRGYDGVVLSDETAIGHNPVEACRIAAIFLNSPEIS